MSERPIGFHYMGCAICTCCVADMIDIGELREDEGVLIDSDGNKATPLSPIGYPDGFTCADCDWNVGGVE